MELKPEDIFTDEELALLRSIDPLLSRAQKAFYENINPTHAHTVRYLRDWLREDSWTVLDDEDDEDDL